LSKILKNGNNLVEGQFNFSWNGTDDNDNLVSPGDYIIEIIAQSFRSSGDTGTLSIVAIETPKVTISDPFPDIIDSSHSESTLNFNLNTDSSVTVAIEKKVNGSFQNVITLVNKQPFSG